MEIITNVTASFLLDDASSLLSDSDGGDRWETQLCHLSTASFGCTLYRPQLRNHKFQASNSFAQSSNFLVRVIGDDFSVSRNLMCSRPLSAKMTLPRTPPA